MFNSYDSVTQKRRPVIRVIFVVLFASAIFGASVSAASVSEVEIAAPIDLGGVGANFVAPALAEPQADPVEVEAEAEPEADAEQSPVDDNARSNADALSEALVLQAGDVSPSTALIGAVDLDAQDTVPSISAAVDVRNLAGLTDLQEDADEAASGQALAIGGTSETDDAESDAVDVDALLAERSSGIAALEAQVLSIQEARDEAAQADLSLGERAALLADELGAASNEAQAQAAWDAGYALGGGSNLSAFHGTILPCESGSQVNRDTVVGATDDWGRAQINRPVWRSTFESLTGRSFEENIVHPALNGFMAAHIEQVQGLSAWTCWRNR